HPEPHPRAGVLWSVYGLLRTWLLAPERLDAEERRRAHQAAGDFLRDLDAQDREGELGLYWTDCLLEARVQYLAAGNCAEARAVTDRLSGFWTRTGLYPDVIRYNQQLLGYEEHPGPMNWIGRAYDDLAD